MNMPKIEVLSIFCIISLIFLSSCSGGKSDSDHYDREYPVKVSMDFEGGFLYREFGDAVLKVFDYESRSLVPLCAKPNCLHNSADCNAVRKNDAASLFLYHNKLYAFYTDVEAVDAAATVGRVRTAITVSDTDGNNEMILIKFDGEYEDAYPSYIYNGSLYFIAKIHDDIDIAGGASYSSADHTENKLLMLDLSGGKLTEICSLLKGYGCITDITCMTAHKAYISTLYKEEEAKYEDYDSVEEWIEAANKIKPICGSITVDLATGKIRSEEPPIDIKWIYDSHYYAADSGVYVYKSDTGEFEIVLENTNCTNVIDDRYFILYSDEGHFIYDSKTDKTEELPAYANAKSFSPEKFYGDHCFGGIQLKGEEKNVFIHGLAYCKTEDMYKEDCEFTIVYGEEYEVID
ncbi:MAG: hypothetical protein HDT44_12080 [Ruminococcaceae bacterium]|nr:hypothetical protein [Oscillospiraceae bacterium]